MPPLLMLKLENKKMVKKKKVKKKTVKKFILQTIQNKIERS
jgi:hypothetical protein